MSFPFDPTGDLIVVPTKLHGPNGDLVVQLALDTGATQSLVAEHLLMMAGYDTSRVVERTEITTGSGLEYVPQVSITRVEALGRQRRNFRVLSHTLPPTATVDGLLGLDFLRKRRLVLDFRKGRAELS